MPEVFKGVGITEQLGEEIPTNLTFVDETGQEVSLAGYFESEKPVILNFVYHNCPMLCSILLESFTKSMRDMEFVAGEEFDVLTVSFSATDHLAQNSGFMVEVQKGVFRPISGWITLKDGALTPLD